MKEFEIMETSGGEDAGGAGGEQSGGGDAAPDTEVNTEGGDATVEQPAEDEKS